MSQLRRIGRGLGQLWLVLSIVAGGLVGPTAAGHDLVHQHDAGAGHTQHAHHHDQSHDALPGGGPAEADDGCQPDPLCMAGCAHAGSALPPLRLPALSLLRPLVAAAPGPDSFRSRAPERELRPPIPTLNT